MDVDALSIAMLTDEDLRVQETYEAMSRAVPSRRWPNQGRPDEGGDGGRNGKVPTMLH